MNIQEFNHIPGLSTFSVRLTEELLKGKEGDVLTDEYLSSLIDNRSTSTNGSGHGFLITATKRALRAGLVWQRVRGANAIKCLGSLEKISFGKAKTAEIMRKAKKTYNVLKTIDTTQLTQEETRTANALTAQVFMLSQSAKAEVTNALQIRDVSNFNRNILDLFKK